MKSHKKIYRTKTFDRLCHWLLVFVFIFAALSGLALFFPSMRVLSYVLFTPQMTRILHPIFGCLVFALLIVMFLRFAKHNLFNRDDISWIKQMKNIAAGKHVNIPVGKFNAGQKILFWMIIFLILLLFFSGIIIWNAHFSAYFSIPIRRYALLVHAISGIGLILLIIGHAYLAFWEKGTLSSMISGYVTQKWAKTHHSKWYEEITKKKDRP